MPQKKEATAPKKAAASKKKAAPKEKTAPVAETLQHSNAPTLQHLADAIFIKGARMHNLKNVDVAIPRNKLVVVTGVSGSGKSSLTMDTLFAEGQRRYAESLSAYARQFLARMDKPDVDYIRGICPAIAIEQKVTTRTPRSTVGSMTEIYDYLRLLFARVGRTISPVSGKEVKKDSVTDVVDFISSLPEGTRAQIMVPLQTRYGRSIREELNILMQKGFARMFSESGDTLRIEELMEEGSDIPAGMLYLLIDRIVVKPFEEDDIHRLSDSVQTAFYESEGDCLLHVTVPEGANMAENHEKLSESGRSINGNATSVDKYSDSTNKYAGSINRYATSIDGSAISVDESGISINGSVTSIDRSGTSTHELGGAVSKSGNSTHKYGDTTDKSGAASQASGNAAKSLPANGFVTFSSRFEADGIVFEEPSPNLFSFNNPFGACPVCEGFGQVLGIDPDLVIPDKRLSVYEGAVVCWRGEKMSEWQRDFIRTSARFEFPIHKPVMDLSKDEYAMLWDGNGKVAGIKDFFNMVSQNLYKVQYRIMQARYRGKTICPECGGARLRKEALYVKVSGATIADLMALPAWDLEKWFAAMKLNEHEGQIAKRILIEIEQRLKTLLDVGLGYLTLSRLANTLSGGESQRIQLTKFLGSNLTDSLYILDEPSIGLHSRDTERLIRVLKNLRDLGNTVVVVEHDEMMMRESDHIIDMGPLASHLGGEVVAVGNAEELIQNERSLTGQYLSGRLRIEVPKTLRKGIHHIRIEGARQNNLKDVSVSFPLNTLCVVTGVSGSGKTTLVKQTLYPALMKHFATGTERPGMHKALTGDLSAIAGVEMIDQNPIGKSSRSNPVTYIKAYDDIRKLYEKQPLAKMRGYEGRHFSFNTDGGRCDTCKGEGEVIVEMQFLADVHLVCETCKGRRFKEEVLEVKLHNKSIFDVLEMSVDEAIEFFKIDKKIAKAIQPLSDVGLGYVKLGQSSDTLSGGEAQRVKLASFLGRSATKDKLLFIFDEPTTGLHFHDIKKLLGSFYALLEQGHSIIVIEHNTDVIKSSDWVIDLGPEGGEGGGKLLYEGVPAGLKKVKESYTGRYL